MSNFVKHQEKVVFLGDEKVGKSSAQLRMVDKTFNSEYTQTLGVDWKVRTVSLLSGELKRMSIWDTSGQERFRVITTAYLRDANQICLFFDPYNRKSYDNLSTHLNNIHQNAPKEVKITLIATHCQSTTLNGEDITTEQRLVTTEEAEQFVRNNNLEKYLEISSKTGTGFHELESWLDSQAEQRLLKQGLLKAYPYIERLKTWISSHHNVSSKIGQSANTIVTILEDGMRLSKNDKKAAENYFKTHKKELNTHLKVLQQSSYTKTFQNACSAILACVACFGLVGFIPLYYNRKNHGDAFLFWTKGDKQQAELAINLAEKDVSSPKKS